jgi:hypothetical protein
LPSLMEIKKCCFSVCFSLSAWSPICLQEPQHTALLQLLPPSHCLKSEQQSYHGDTAFHERSDGGPEKESDFIKVTQLLSTRTGILNFQFRSFRNVQIKISELSSYLSRHSLLCLFPCFVRQLYPGKLVNIHRPRN